MNKPSTRGGARKGAGRPKSGKKTILMTFSLPKSTAIALAEVPNKSQFVNQAIQKALHH